MTLYNYISFNHLKTFGVGGRRYEIE